MNVKKYREKKRKKISKKNSRVSTVWFMLEITRWCSVLYAQNNHCLCQKGGKKLKENEGKSGRKGIWVCVGVGVLKSVCTGDTMARWHGDTVTQHLPFKATWDGSPHPRAAERNPHLSMGTLSSFLLQNCEQNSFLLHLCSCCHYKVPPTPGKKWATTPIS